MQNKPTLLGFKRSQSDKTLTVWCPYCSEWHNHGEETGHVVAHCTLSTSPFKDTGYHIKRITKAEMDQLKEWSR